MNGWRESNRVSSSYLLVLIISFCPSLSSVLFCPDGKLLSERSLKSLQTLKKKDDGEGDSGAPAGV